MNIIIIIVAFVVGLLIGILSRKKSAQSLDKSKLRQIRLELRTMYSRIKQRLFEIQGINYEILSSTDKLLERLEK